MTSSSRGDGRGSDEGKESGLLEELELELEKNSEGGRRRIEERLTHCGSSVQTVKYKRTQAGSLYSLYPTLTLTDGSSLEG